uniref:Tail completion protein n=1 Tax=Siphoviridae sp. ctjfQ5 TaxID=2823594 RepID=A0A8S5L8H9_9CAUD|nr:MAG TPA: tail completion protein [Siphoviridae sp. ctjfQ5]
MPEYPYCYYSVLAPRIPEYSFGLQEIVDAPDGPLLVRSEQVSATMSFTFCSTNRETEDGYIFGEDEALELAEKANGFFLLNAHNIQTEQGEVVIVNVGSVASRSSFFVEDTIRRYGFDIRFSYVRTDTMPATLVERPGNPIGNIKQ